MADVREALIGQIAHLITGYVAAQCCHRTGGWGRKDGRPCDCREAAEEILSSGLVVPAGNVVSVERARDAMNTACEAMVIEARAERDAAHAAIRELLEAVDAWDDDEGWYVVNGRLGALRALVQPASVKEAGDA